LCQIGGIVENRRGWQRSRGRGQAYSYGARMRIAIAIGSARGIDEIDGVHAVAAAAFGCIYNVVEDREAPEVGVLADLVCLVPQLRNVETSDRCRKARVHLRVERLVRVSQDLRSGTHDDASRLWVATIAGIAGRVEHAGVAVQDRGAPVVAAVRIGFGEAKPSVLI
jgi:hypothetical protein